MESGPPSDHKDNSGRRGFPLNNPNFLAALSAVLFSANLACALSYLACLYLARNYALDTPQNDGGYDFLRGVVNVADFLHRAAFSPVATSAVARGDSILWRPGLLLLTVLGTIWSVGFLIHLFIRLWFLVYRSTFLQPIAGIVALFSAPLFCVGVRQLTSNWQNDYPNARPSLAHNILLWILIAELIIFFAFLASRRGRRVSSRTRAVLLILHFIFWAAALFPSAFFYIAEPRYRIFIHITTWLIPSAGAAFLIYLWPQPSPGFVFPRPLDHWSIIAALFGAAILLFIWLPRTARYSSDPADLAGTTIELSRGPCFGSCPVYTLKIHGNGDVEFEGMEGTKIKGKETGKITPQEFTELMATLDRARFFDLEDRAFTWCFDTPSVAVTVSTDHQTKKVSSDSFCKGAKAGRQASFVEATYEIDEIVGSDRWVSCDGRRCR